MRLAQWIVAAGAALALAGCGERGPEPSPVPTEGVTDAMIAAADGNEWLTYGRDYGEHAGQWCGYARKTTPHKCPIGAPAPILNLNGGIRTHDPSARIFCSMRAFVGAWETHPSRSEWPFPAARERPLLLNIT